jgi:large subunit ribosomal protein L22
MQDTKSKVQAISKLRNCQMSARKMRLSADLLRGLSVTKALGISKFTRKEGAKFLYKMLLSSLANWSVKTKEDAVDFDLYVKAIWVDQGTQLKRFQPAPHGRAHRIRKHSCHVTIVVENKLPLSNEEVVLTETSSINSDING